MSRPPDFTGRDARDKAGSLTDTEKSVDSHLGWITEGNQTRKVYWRKNRNINKILGVENAFWRRLKVSWV